MMGAELRIERREEDISLFPHIILEYENEERKMSMQLQNKKLNK
jgi:hypothetical protein